MEITDAWELFNRFLPPISFDVGLLSFPTTPGRREVVLVLPAEGEMLPWCVFWICFPPLPCYEPRVRAYSGGSLSRAPTNRLSERTNAGWFVSNRWLVGIWAKSRPLHARTLGVTAPALPFVAWAWSASRPLKWYPAPQHPNQLPPLSHPDGHESGCIPSCFWAYVVFKRRAHIQVYAKHSTLLHAVIHFNV